MSLISRHELQTAVTHLAEIQQRLAAAEVFRGYRSATVAATAVLGVAGAVVQALWYPEPLANPLPYIALWVSIAIACSLTSLAQVGYRSWRSGSPRELRSARAAVEPLLPSLILGAAVTWAIADWHPAATWLLPALWSGLFGLGILGCSRLLPRPVALVGIYYVLSAMLPLAAGPGHWACSPWWMIQSFGVGQAAIAWILYWYLERSTDAQGSQSPGISLSEFPTDRC